MKVTTDEGKYTFIFDEKTGEFNCLRYGEQWQNLAGDKMVLSLVQELDVAKLVIKDILQHLPVNNDWLDPEIKRVAKELIKY